MPFFFLTFLPKIVNPFEDISQVNLMSFWIRGFIDELKIAAAKDAFLTDAQCHWQTLSLINVLLSVFIYSIPKILNVRESLVRFLKFASHVIVSLISIELDVTCHSESLQRAWEQPESFAKS